MDATRINPADANQITRAYFDALLLEMRLLGSDLPDTGVTLFGQSFQTPVMMAALSHLNSCHPDGLVEMARGAQAAGAVMFCGMGEEDELERIVKTGAQTVKIIKPYADREKLRSRIRHACACGVLALGVDIDHAFSSSGGYDVVLGEEMRPLTVDELRQYVQESSVPFIAKGVLSVRDALLCADAGVSGIIVSHHHGIMPYAVPPLFMLPDIRKAAGDRLRIFVDCGVESGLDAFKCLALGADAVCVGRAMMDALRQGGAQAVHKAILRMTGELSATMARTGSPRTDAIDPTLVHLRTFSL